MKIEKLEQFIKDELKVLGFKKSKYAEYQYKDINIWEFCHYNIETLIISYCDSKCDNNDMSYDTCFTTNCTKKDIKAKLKFIKDCQGELEKGYGCVWVNYPVK